MRGSWDLVGWPVGTVYRRRCLHEAVGLALAIGTGAKKRVSLAGTWIQIPALTVSCYGILGSCVSAFWAFLYL